MISKNHSLTSALVETIRAYRLRAAKADVAQLSISIEAHGRVDGDWEIKYSVAEGRYSSGVDGNTLEDVFVEFLRRKGWTEQHRPMCLPNVEGGDLHGDAVYGED